MTIFFFVWTLFFADLGFHIGRHTGHRPCVEQRQQGWKDDGRAYTTPKEDSK